MLGGRGRRIDRSRGFEQDGGRAHCHERLGEVHHLFPRGRDGHRSCGNVSLLQTDNSKSLRMTTPGINKLSLFSYLEKTVSGTIRSAWIECIQPSSVHSGVARMDLGESNDGEDGGPAYNGRLGREPPQRPRSTAFGHVVR